MKETELLTHIESQLKTLESLRARLRNGGARAVEAATLLRTEEEASGSSEPAVTPESPTLSEVSADWDEEEAMSPAPVQAPQHPPPRGSTAVHPPRPQRTAIQDGVDPLEASVSRLKRAADAEKVYQASLKHCEGGGPQQQQQLVEDVAAARAREEYRRHVIAERAAQREASLQLKKDAMDKERAERARGEQRRRQEELAERNRQAALMREAVQRELQEQRREEERLKASLRKAVDERRATYLCGERQREREKRTLSQTEYKRRADATEQTRKREAEAAKADKTLREQVREELKTAAAKDDDDQKLRGAAFSFGAAPKKTNNPPVAAKKNAPPKDKDAAAQPQPQPQQTAAPGSSAGSHMDDDDDDDAWESAAKPSASTRTRFRMLSGDDDGMASTDYNEATSAFLFRYLPKQAAAAAVVALLAAAATAAGERDAALGSPATPASAPAPASQHSQAQRSPGVAAAPATPETAPAAESADAPAQGTTISALRARVRSTKAAAAAAAAAARSPPQAAAAASPPAAAPPATTTSTSTADRHDALNQMLREKAVDKQKSTAMVDSALTQLRESANVSYKAARYSEAINIYTKAIQLYLTHPEVNPTVGTPLYLNRSASYMMLGRYSDALRDASQAAEIEPSSAKAAFRMGKLHLLLGNPKKARMLYTQGQSARAVHSINIQDELKALDAVEQCLRHRDGGNYQQAHNAVEAAISYLPCLFFQQLKCEALIMFDPKAALAILESLAKSHKNVADVHFLKGKAIMYSGHDRVSTNESLMCLAEALLVDPSHQKARAFQSIVNRFEKLRDEGNKAFENADWDAAYASYTKALSLDSYNHSLKSVILLNRAAVLIQQGLHEQACEDCNCSILFDEKNHKAYVRRAKCLNHMGNIVGAIKDLRRAAKLHPTPEYLEKLALAEAELASRTAEQQQQQRPSTSSTRGSKSRPPPAPTPEPGFREEGASQPQGSAGSAKDGSFYCRGRSSFANVYNSAAGGSGSGSANAGKKRKDDPPTDTHRSSSAPGTGFGASSTRPGRPESSGPAGGYRRGSDSSAGGRTTPPPAGRSTPPPTSGRSSPNPDPFRAPPNANNASAGGAGASRGRYNQKTPSGHSYGAGGFNRSSSAHTFGRNGQSFFKRGFEFKGFGYNRGGSAGAQGGASAGGAGTHNHSYSSHTKAQAPKPPKAVSYYELLSVTTNAKPADIKAAYRKAALKWHPDRWVTATDAEKNKAEKKFKEINTAYSIISDPTKRRQYDLGKRDF